MKSIGIIANPNSGKDVRRLYSYATTISNHEKVNLMERMILGAQDLGVEKIFIMPDNSEMGSNAKSSLELNGDLKADIEILDFRIMGTYEDTIQATKEFIKRGVHCIIILGGDGTNRLVAAKNSNIPIIPISTGTNNVYPRFYEGTTVGMAAAILCEYGMQDDYIIHDKIIEVYKNGEIIDYALIDVAITNQIFVGNRAIENIKDISELIVSRSHPASIGFSSIIGVQALSTYSDDFGYRTRLHCGRKNVLAPFTAGKMTTVECKTPSKMELNQMYVSKPTQKGTIALDGERILPFESGELLGFVIRRKGPLRIDVEAALEYGLKRKFFV